MPTHPGPPQTQAIVAIRAPVPVQQEENGWAWWPNEPDHDNDDLVWIFDGSCKYAAQWHLARTGCGVVVITRSGNFVACAHATPPSWVKKSSEAEAWALYLIIRDATAPPRMLTDCMSLIQTASRGTRRAVDGRSSSARIWSLIASVLDGSITQLCGRLKWLPAHKSLVSALSRYKSDGSPVLAWEWRANALADALAKHGAPDCTVAQEVCALIQSAGAALQHSAAILGAATRAANNRRIEEKQEDGSTRVTILRDASDRPEWTHNDPSSSGGSSSNCAPETTSLQAKQPSAKPQKALPELPDQQLQQLSTPLRTPAASLRSSIQATHCSVTARRHAARAARQRDAELGNAATALAVAGITARSSNLTGPTAAERMAALKARLSNRSA